MLPRELLEGKPLEEGTVLRAYVDEGGNVVLRPIAPVPLRKYAGEDLETFARENEITPRCNSASTPCSSANRPFTDANVLFGADISPRSVSRGPPLSGRISTLV